MRIDRADAAMAIRPYIVSALEREFLSSGFDHQLPTQLFSRDLPGDQSGEEGYVAHSSAARDRFSKPTTGPRKIGRPAPGVLAFLAGCGDDGIIAGLLSRAVSEQVDSKRKNFRLARDRWQW